MNKRAIATVMIIMILVLLACVTATPPGPGTPAAYSASTPSPLSGSGQEAAYTAAQATLIAGQGERMALSHQATVVSLNIDQAANVAAQAADVAAQTTLDYNQRQLTELSIRATEVSINIARAAATQQSITQQTETARVAAATAESQAATATAQSQANAATATYSAYVLNVTQTAQVQAILDGHAAETAQVHATLTAYPLTATPEAATQAYIAHTRSEHERQAWWADYVITPLRALLSTLVVLLLIVGGVVAFRRLMPVLEYRLRNPRMVNNTHHLTRVDRMILDLDPQYHRRQQPELLLLKHPQLSSDETLPVEVIDPSEPSVINWITEAERKLRSLEQSHHEC